MITTTDTVSARQGVVLVGRGSDRVRCARPGVLYAISASADGVRLYALDRFRGLGGPGVHITPSPSSEFGGLTIRPGTQTLYGAFTSTGETDLYSLSSEQGDLEFQRSVPLGNVSAMAYSQSDDLYLSTARGDLYRQQGEGMPELVGATGHAFTGLAFNPATNVLWGTVLDSVFTVDRISGQAKLIGKSQWNAPRSSIAFNPVGTLYGLYGINLVTIGKVWGEPTVVGPTGIESLVGIAMRCDAASLEAESSSELPREIRLLQNYPNPFNPTTVIRFELPEAGTVRLSVYDLLGRELALILNERKTPGFHSVEFDGSALASGVYFYRLTTGSFVQSRRMMLVK
ncbi:T9SS type A sorting domain-containing protein [bacterium]|nr:T9SS type A sorting domain-containing protein [bacterium]